MKTINIVIMKKVVSFFWISAILVGMFLLNIDAVYSTNIALSTMQSGNQPGAILPNLGITSGENVSISVNAFNLSDLEGVDMIIQYDHSVVEVMNASLSGGILAGMNYNLIFNASQPGQIYITIYAQGNLFSGDGNIVFVEFEGLNEGVSSLAFTFFEINEENYLENCTNGSITVSNTQNLTGAHLPDLNGTSGEIVSVPFSGSNLNDLEGIDLTHCHPKVFKKSIFKDFIFLKFN
jgi:hypothetical protein